MTRSFPPRADREAGYSLLEIMIALVILALAAAMVSVAFAGAGSGMRFEESARNLAAGAREAQLRALRTGRDVSLVIDVDQRAFAVSGDPWMRLPADVSLRVTSAGEHFAAQRRPAFVFAPDGGSTGGTIEMSRLDRKATIRIDWLTGETTVIYGGADAAPT